MYTQFFGLRHPPFSIAPDPRYLFMSERHREALAHLLFGLNSGGGFVLLTGEIGAGKTTVCRLFLEQIPPRCNVAYIFNPKQTVLELLQSICDEFGIDTAAAQKGHPTVKSYIDPLNTYLLATHAIDQNNVLIIDEAQNLSADVLEQLRLLTNLETNERKLLQIVLIGQPELRTMLAKPELEQLAQRVIARFHLDALSHAETVQYTEHRLRVAGNTGMVPFTWRAMRRIYQRTRGIPRRINLLCDRALLSAYANGKREVDTATIDLAAREVFGLDAAHAPTSSAVRWRPAAAGVVLAMLILGGAVFALQYRPATVARSPAVTTKTTTAPSAPNTPAVQATPGASAPGVASVSAVPVVSLVVSDNPQPEALPAVLSSQSRDVNNAYQQLGRLWQLSLSPDAPCEAAQKVGVYCYRSSKGLAEIRQLDRPGILTLHDDAQKNYYVLLLGLDARQALLQIGDQLQTVSLNALAHRWQGEFATMWRGPAGARRGIAHSDRGAVVDWLIRHLALARGETTPVVSISESVFDTALATQVREFQLAQGLHPDGVAGAQTLMRLISVTQPNEPHLNNVPVTTTSSQTKK